MDIAGKVFIVTGGASGLGEGTARMLAGARRQGRRRRPAGRAGRGASPPRSAAASSAATSARRPTARRSSPRRSALGKLVGLVNCAGIAPGGEDRRQGRRASARAVHQDDHRQPDRQLQHDPARRRGDEQERARADRRARRADLDRQRRRLRRPDRPGRLLGVEGRHRRHDPADRPRPGAQRHPQHDDRAGHLRHADAVHHARTRCRRRWPRACRSRAASARRPTTPSWCTRSSPTTC